MKKNTNDNEIEMPKLKSIYNTIVNTTIISVDKIKTQLNKQNKNDKKKKNTKNKKKKKEKSIIDFLKKPITIIVLSIILIILISVYVYISVPPKVLNVYYSKSISKKNTQLLTIEYKINNKFPTKCKLNNNKWVKATNNKCMFEVSTGTNKIYIKNLFNKKELSELVNVTGVKSIKLDGEKFYLALGEKIKLNVDIEKVGDADTSLKWLSSNPEIVSVDDGVINGLQNGEALITVSSKNETFYTTKVIVTDIISPMELNDRKSFLTCNVYSEEEALILDDILSTRVKLKGEKSRAALIETIRFITLSFKYKVPYFFENGRLKPYGKMNYVDGEGRYYHKGLYLSDSKKEDIVSSFVGPSIWGCPLTNFDDLYGWTIGGKYPNGLDCSGFVSWALYNSGLDVGDIGAGISANVDDLSDLGEMHKLTYDLINNREFKVGDIIGWDGHIALIAGIDDENIYIAESLSRGVRLATFNYKNRYSDLYKMYTYVNNMDSVYEKDGNYNDMW